MLASDKTCWHKLATSLVDEVWSPRPSTRMESVCASRDLVTKVQDS